MDKNIKVIGKMINFMELEIFIPKIVIIKDNLFMVLKLEKDFNILIMEILMKVNIEMDFFMDKEDIYGKMGHCIKVSLKQIKWKEKVFGNLIEEIHIKVAIIEI